MWVEEGGGWWRERERDGVGGELRVVDAFIVEMKRDGSWIRVEEKRLGG